MYPGQMWLRMGLNRPGCPWLFFFWEQLLACIPPNRVGYRTLTQARFHSLTVSSKDLPRSRCRNLGTKRSGLTSSANKNSDRVGRTLVACPGTWCNLRLYEERKKACRGQRPLLLLLIKDYCGDTVCDHSSSAAPHLCLVHNFPPLLLLRLVRAELDWEAFPNCWGYHRRLSIYTCDDHHYPTCLGSSTVKSLFLPCYHIVLCGILAFYNYPGQESTLRSRTGRP